jgi:hypothetical protein
VYPEHKAADGSAQSKDGGFDVISPNGFEKLNPVRKNDLCRAELGDTSVGSGGLMWRAMKFIVLAVALIGAGVGIGWLAFRGTPSSAADEITSDSFRLERVYVVAVHIPNPEIEKVLEAVTAAVPLNYGYYDQVAFLDAPGLEQYRGREGSKGGASEKAGRTPTTRVSFSIPRDAEALAKVLAAIRHTHSYEEPVIYVHEAWRSRTTDRDESNPNRWWNQKGQ